MPDPTNPILDSALNKFLEKEGNRKRYVPKDKHSGFIPRPLRGGDAPTQRRSLPTYAEATGLIEQDSTARTVEVVRSKGNVLINYLTTVEGKRRAVTAVTREHEEEVPEETEPPAQPEDMVGARVQPQGWGHARGTVEYVDPEYPVMARVLWDGTATARVEDLRQLEVVA